MSGKARIVSKLIIPFVIVATPIYLLVIFPRAFVKAMRQFVKDEARS